MLLLSIEGSELSCLRSRLPESVICHKQRDGDEVFELV
jgi:hypothetical protein